MHPHGSHPTIVMLAAWFGLQEAALPAIELFDLIGITESFENSLEMARRVLDPDGCYNFRQGERCEQGTSARH